jgi:hypothetical protein
MNQFRQQEQVRYEMDEKLRQATRQQTQMDQRDTAVQNILALLPQASAAGVNYEGFEDTPENPLIGRLQSLTPQEAGQLESALTGEIGAKGYEISTAQESAKAQAAAAKDISKLAGADKSQAIAAWYRRRPGESGGSKRKYSDFTTGEGVFRVYDTKDGPVTVKLPVPATGPLSDDLLRSAQRAMESALDWVEKDAESYPDKYKDEEGNISEAKKSAAATKRADEIMNYGEKYVGTPAPVRVTNPDNQASGDSPAPLFDYGALGEEGLTEEEIDLLAEIEFGLQ